MNTIIDNIKAAEQQAENESMFKQLQEVEDLQLLEQTMTEDEERESLIEKARASLMQGVPIRITERMTELGIAGIVLDMAFHANAAAKLNRLMADDDDYEPFSMSF